MQQYYERFLEWAAREPATLGGMITPMCNATEVAERRELERVTPLRPAAPVASGVYRKGPSWA
jgi:hypothetical protein